MADYSAIYTLGAITFNNGVFAHGSNDNLYWIDTIHGLDGPTLRVPAEDVPFGHGGIVHKSWKGPRHPVFEGRLIVQSTGAAGCQAVLDAMESALLAALEAIIAPSSGTLAWPGHSMTVFYERTCEFQPADNYRTRSFDFGLISESGDT